MKKLYLCALCSSDKSLDISHFFLSDTEREIININFILAAAGEDEKFVFMRSVFK